MLQTSLLSSTDLADYTWPADELARFNAYMAGSEPLWHPPPDRKDKEARKAYFVAAIKDWIAHCRQRPAMSLHDIQANADRFLVHRVLLDSVANACRALPTADRLLAVLVCDILFSDSSKLKYSDVSAERMGELLSCGERAVRLARERLAERKIMVREKRPGFTDKHWPVINPKFAGEDLHPMWWLDATSDPPAPRGKPSKERISDAGVRADNPGSVRTPLYDNPGSVTPKPRISDADEFSNEFSKREKSGAPANAGSVDSNFEEFWRAFPPGRKQDRRAALDLFRKIVTGKHKTLHASSETLIAAARRYAASKPDPEYTPKPGNWLNGGRWDDDVCGVDADAAKALQEHEERLARLRAEQDAEAADADGS